MNQHDSSSDASVTNRPAAVDVVALYRAVVRDGLPAHADQLGLLARAAAEVGAEPSLVRLLEDRTAPDQIRTRAVARLASQWPALTATPEPGVLETFRELLARWNAHQDLRSAGGVDVAELATSRWRLDRARRAHHAARRAHTTVPTG